MKKSAIYAGSFDPITNGHLDIIKRAAKLFDTIIVAISPNNNKKPLFTATERLDMVNEAIHDIDGAKAIIFEGLLADLVNKNKFDAVIRGLRATTDFEFEIQMAQMNARLYTGSTETIFFMTDPRYSFISSSLIKEVASYKGNINELVPSHVEQMLINKFIQQP